MNNDGGSPPCVVALASMEDEVTAANRVAGHVLTPEADGHGPLLPEDPISMLNEVSKHRRMVANLEHIHGFQGETNIEMVQGRNILVFYRVYITANVSGYKIGSIRRNTCIKQLIPIKTLW